jgi:hypothetical protein
MYLMSATKHHFATIMLKRASICSNFLLRFVEVNIHETLGGMDGWVLVREIDSNI